MHDANPIHRFVRVFRGRHLVWSVALAVLAQALPVAVLLCILELLFPSWLGVAAAAGVLWVVAYGARAWLRHRSPLARLDRELGLGDRLLTYVGLQGGKKAPLLAPWLEQDLAAQLAAVPEERTSSLWRRPLGRTRYLLPILVLLLLLRQFAPLPEWPGMSGPPLAQNGGGGGGAGGSEGDPSPSEGPATPEETPDAPPEAGTPPPPEPPPQTPPPDEPPPPDPQAEEPPGPPEPPAEDVRVVEEFVVPSFIGDGETRRQLSRLALSIEEEGPRPAAPTATPPRGAGARTPPAVDPAEQSYEKALERALRARHVPLAERPFVRSYFEQLVEKAR